MRLHYFIRQAGNRADSALRLLIEKPCQKILSSYRSRKSVYVSGVYRPDKRQWHQNQHGWQGPCRHNVFIARLWRSIKYEGVYLHIYDSVADSRQGLDSCFTFYNSRRTHSSRNERTPDKVYFESLPQLLAA